jgi:hypothetical protein
MQVLELETNKIYDTLSKWWEGNKWPAVPLDMLPPKTLFVDGFCAGFLMETNTSMCFFEWMVGNPEADKIERSEALDLLAQVAIETAKSRGFKVLACVLENKRLINRMQKYGFTIGDANATTLIMRIQ